jgi:hypothetical protein
VNIEMSACVGSGKLIISLIQRKWSNYLAKSKKRCINWSIFIFLISEFNPFAF